MSEAFLFATPDEFEKWLAQNSHMEKEIWLRLSKKSAKLQTLNYQHALTVALCWGWIDGVKQSDSDEHFLQRFTPRKPSSPWSLINRKKAEELIEQGKMHAAGLAEIEKAKANGLWDKAYAGSASIEVPDDLQKALEAHPKAAAHFKTLDRQNRFAILYRIGNVKRAETRAKKIIDFVAMLARGEKPHP